MLLLAIIGALAWYFTVFKSEEEPLASCGDCYCIVGGENGGECPSWSPQINHTNFESYKKPKLVDAYELSCDPYSVNTCETSPSQDDQMIALGETAVCAIHFIDTSTCTASAGSEYQLVTYASQEEALAAGGFVTHLGACGLCSSLQDLAVYLEYPGLTTEGKFCASKKAISIEAGNACYRNLGMSDGCARIWAEAEGNTFRDCFTDCFLGDLDQNNPNNGPAPECKLNNCLQCDQDRSAEILAKYAGRTRRRSGLLSPVARKCEEIAQIDHDPCPVTVPL